MKSRGWSHAPNFTYDGKNITRRGKSHKNMWDIQGSLMTRSHMIIRFNEGNLVNSHNLPIMGKIHHSKECGHYIFHGVNIITSKEHIEI